MKGAPGFLGREAQSTQTNAPSPGDAADAGSLSFRPETTDTPPARFPFSNAASSAPRPLLPATRHAAHRMENRLIPFIAVNTIQNKSLPLAGKVNHIPLSLRGAAAKAACTHLGPVAPGGGRRRAVPLCRRLGADERTASRTEWMLLRVRTDRLSGSFQLLVPQKERDTPEGMGTEPHDAFGELRTPVVVWSGLA